MVLLGSATEGTKRMETKDADGYQMVKEIIRVGQEPDGGYTDYVFPKEGETESSPKRSYSRAFEPFGWVVGTGNYIDYIDETVEKETQAMRENVKTALIAIIGTGSLLIVIVMAVCLYMAFSLSRSFQVAQIQKVTEEDYNLLWHSFLLMRSSCLPLLEMMWWRAMICLMRWQTLITRMPERSMH